MPKDPERYGSIDSVAEDIDDVVVQAGTNSRHLKILMHFFKSMFEVAKPFTNLKTKRINAPNGRLPIDDLDPRVIKAINGIDNAFVETMRTTEWIEAFVEGYKKCKEKLIEIDVDWNERIK